MSVELHIASQLRLAKADLEAAQVLLKVANRNASYQLEQSAEKIILAVLTSEGKHRGIAHHLKAMVDMIPDENPMKVELRGIQHLEAFATTYRYPTTSGRIKPAPLPQSVSEDIQKVEKVLSNAIAKFRVDLSKPDSPAGVNTPLR